MSNLCNVTKEEAEILFHFCLGTVTHTQMTSSTIVTMTMASHSSHATAVTTSTIPVGMLTLWPRSCNIHFCAAAFLNDMEQNELRFYNLEVMKYYF